MNGCGENALRSKLAGQCGFAEVSVGADDSVRPQNTAFFGNLRRIRNFPEGRCGHRPLHLAYVFRKQTEYTSWERPQNERHNGLFRTLVPKGVSIEAFSAAYILAAADELNGRPRKKLGYRTPEELFDEFLDSVYAAEGCGSIAQDGSQRLPS